MFAGLALALGGGHLAIATLAALPALTRLAHLAVPELVRRHGSWGVASAATWLERAGFLLAALFGIVRPEGWAVPGLLAGIGVGFLGQTIYDASLAALHTEATLPGTFGRYTATKARWAAISGLVLGVLASLAVDAAERAAGVPPNIARTRTRPRPRSRPAVDGGHATARDACAARRPPLDAGAVGGCEIRPRVGLR